jgi:diguanylate cyclase (GGDEF)-like protein
LRPLSIIALIVGLLLLPISFAVATSDRSHAQSQLDRGLISGAHDEATSLDAYFARARAIDLITAHDPGFTNFYLTGGRTGNSFAHRQAVAQTVAALNYLEQIYPASIGEACFIDHSGAEIARVVRGTPATTSDLSPDESGNPFFAPTFALGASVARSAGVTGRPALRTVYQARPYVSPDTHEWVISNSTVLPGPNGATRGIVHFEITIESFRQEAAKLAGGFDVRVVDGATGRVVLDKRKPQRLGAALGDPRNHDFAFLAREHDARGVATVAGHRVAWKQVGQTAGNANRWYAVYSSASPLPSWLTSFGVGPIAMLVIGVLLSLFGAITLRARRRELEAAAATDELTGLANRRQLMADLTVQCHDADVDRPAILVLLDLNGFKLYNDSFGHPAGDALLARLANNLGTALAGIGTAYRLGGDEFCVLADAAGPGRDHIVATAASALVEHGEGFSITASYGAAVIPDEATTPAEAVRTADTRMYAQKSGGRPSAEQQSAAVLLAALSERHAGLAAHLDDVAALSTAVGKELELPDEEVDHIRKAAELHDVGKVAVPDAILNKPGPLDPDEWDFIKGHTIVGERIISAAPCLETVAKLVRSTHEHNDGSGYPDGLRETQIPLGARIIAVCDAYDAITSDRPYRPAQSHEEAIAELRHCRGTHFDPAIVEIFCSVIARERARATPTAAR